MALIANIQRLWVRLLGNHLIVGLVPVLIGTGLLVYTARGALEQAVLDSRQQVAQRAAREIHHFLAQPIASLKVLAQSMNVVRDPWQRQSLLSQVGLELGVVAELCFVDTAGSIQATNVLDVHAPFQRGERLPPGYLPHARVLWSQVKREGLYASAVTHYKGQPSLFVGLAVQEADQVVGALIARFTLYEIWQQADQIRLGATGRGVLLDARGRYISFPSPQAVYRDTAQLFVPRLSGTGTRQWRDLEGREWVAGFAYIADWGWTVVVQQEAREAFGLVAMMQHRANWILVAAVAGAVVLGLLLLRSITRPINRLMHAVRAVQAGKAFKLELPVIKDELWELGQAFGDMNQALEARKAALEAELHFNDRLIDDNPLALGVLNLQRRTVRANRAWHELFGQGRAGAWDQTAAGQQLLAWLERNPKGPQADNLQVEGPEGGSQFWNLKVVDLEAALPGHLLVVVDDQTQHKLLEMHHAQAEKLASLGEMAAGVAHEIKNPLAIIRHAYELLAQIVPPEVEGREQALRPLGAAIGRIDERIVNLLDFARPARQTQEWIDPTGILRQLVALEQKRAEHLGIAIAAHLHEVPPVWMNRDMLKDIFLNLISNALAAMPDGGTLRLAVEQRDDWVVVEVGDTGTGIPQAHIRQIFEPFYSTKPPGQGTGLGLAIVHRQIQEIGGRIEVESTPGRGTNFSLYLPN